MVEEISAKGHPRVKALKFQERPICMNAILNFSSCLVHFFTNVLLNSHCY